MPYSAEINRNAPAGILILVDQSRSMHETIDGDDGPSKAEGVADAVNRLLQGLVLKSAKPDGIRDYFQVGVIGYGLDCQYAFGSDSIMNALVPISSIADHPTRIETRTRLVEVDDEFVEQPYKMPIWFEAHANGATPMAEAFTMAEDVLRRFTVSYPQSFPPIVINLTDGKPTDANPLPIARRIQSLQTDDGAALVFNLLLSDASGPAFHFLADENLLADTYLKLLFRMSSELPPRMADAARSEGFRIEPGARGTMINADMSSVVRFLDIGTRVTMANPR